MQSQPSNSRSCSHPKLETWWLAQKPAPILDIEHHPNHGGYLTVAHPGLTDDDRDLDSLYAQTSHLLDVMAL